jgi:hypothetical protein
MVGLFSFSGFIIHDDVNDWLTAVHAPSSFKLFDGRIRPPLKTACCLWHKSVEIHICLPLDRFLRRSIVCLLAIRDKLLLVAICLRHGRFPLGCEASCLQLFRARDDTSHNTLIIKYLRIVCASRGTIEVVVRMHSSHRLLFFTSDLIFIATT